MQKVTKFSYRQLTIQLARNFSKVDKKTSELGKDAKSLQQLQLLRINEDETCPVSTMDSIM